MRLNTHTLRHAVRYAGWSDAAVAWSPPKPRGVHGPSYAALRTGFARLRRRATRERLALFREHLGRTVATASPLLVRMCSLEGADPDALARRLRPDVAWTDWLCGPEPGRLAVESYYRRFQKPVRRDWLWLERFAHGGLVVRARDAGDGDGWGVRVLDGGFEMAAFLGAHRVRTTGATGALSLCMRLPDTIVAALPGMALDRLVGHPLLDGCGAVVTSVDPSDMWGVKVHFALPPVAWRMPWARDGETATATGPRSRRRDGR